MFLCKNHGLLSDSMVLLPCLSFFKILDVPKIPPCVCLTRVKRQNRFEKSTCNFLATCNLPGLFASAVIHVTSNYLRAIVTRGSPGGLFHSKGTWGCAARKGILFRTSSLAGDILMAILVEFSLDKGRLFGDFGQRNVKIRLFL